MLTPLAKKVLVKPVEMKYGSILVNNQKPNKFTVHAIGDEITKVIPGNTIFLEKHYGVEIEHENEKYLIIDESSILARLD